MGGERVRRELSIPEPFRPNFLNFSHDNVGVNFLVELAEEEIVDNI